MVAVSVAQVDVQALRYSLLILLHTLSRRRGNLSSQSDQSKRLPAAGKQVVWLEGVSKPENRFGLVMSLTSANQKLPPPTRVGASGVS